MKRHSYSNLMKPLIVMAFLAALATLVAADAPSTPKDPLAGAFFPPELVLLARERTRLSPEMAQTIRAHMEQEQTRLEGLKMRLEHETMVLSTLAKEDRVDELKVNEQLDRVLAIEREAKHVQLGLLISVKNLLTPAQQEVMRELVKDGGAKFTSDLRRRLTEKVERVKVGAQKWAASGRDPSAITQEMQRTVGPLLDAGNPIEAEAELDRLLGRLDSDAK